MSAVNERYVVPRVNVLEHDDAVVIEAEVPGVARDQAEIEVRDGTLYLKAHAPKNGETKNGYHVQERFGASYYRAFKLGNTINPEKIEAKLKDGLLTVTLGKSDRLKPRAIAVN
jgi:HSP20 family protein